MARRRAQRGDRDIMSHQPTSVFSEHTNRVRSHGSASRGGPFDLVDCSGVKSVEIATVQPLEHR